MSSERTPYSPPTAHVADAAAAPGIPAKPRRPIGVWIVTLYSVPWALTSLGWAAYQFRFYPHLLDLFSWWQLCLWFISPALLIVASILLFRLLKPALVFFVIHFILAEYPYVLLILSSGGGIRNIQGAFGGRFFGMTADFLAALIPAIYAWYLNKQGVLKPFR